MNRSFVLQMAVGLIVTIAISRHVPPYYVSLLTEVVILGLLAMGLNVLVGYRGLPSLGHAAFFGVAAYTATLVGLRMGENPWLCTAAGILAAVVLAALYGLLVVRTRGVYFLMITLALAQVLWAVAFRWRSFTGGDDGLPGLGRPDFGLPWSLWPAANFFYFTLAIFALVALALHVILRSPFGEVLQGMRESESRMRALGYDIQLWTYVAFVLSGSVAGIAGVLFAFYNGFVSPSELGVTLSGDALFMVILGGPGTFFGPVLGSGFVVLLRNVLSAYTERWMVVFGALYVLVAMFMPRGVVAALGDLARRWRGAGNALRPEPAPQKAMGGRGR